MNGTHTEESGGGGGPAVDRRPIITCAGELEVFSTIEDNLSQSLPQETAEWRRSMGRPARQVRIGANFAPFSPASLPKGNQWDLIRQPLFHIYWTECTDVDLYKTTVRDDIEGWLKELTTRDIGDFLIVVVENYDGKRANKLLPRTTVLDKIRTDFAPKQGDRCISVINPSKVEARSADSWRGLVSRIRHLLLVAYAKAVARLEDHVRQQRERRNETGWSFMQYFELQEELALVLEMLGLYDEALVQYDELEVLFSQFVVNGIVGDSLGWLSEFQKPLERWHGLRLPRPQNQQKLEKKEEGKPGERRNDYNGKLSRSPSILELRAYIYAKQAQMLMNLNKVWEMASRCLPFLHTTIRELTVLEIAYPPGALSCWLFLAATEVLQICEQFNNSEEVEAYSLHTASLWAYASQKLRDLGELCGLMPGGGTGTPTSAQLHIVVGLSAGMGDDPGEIGSPSPTDKLKKALCSKEIFNKTYLELAELAMCTYKHIGRLRSARLIGREVASFYVLTGETQTAAAFLTEAVRTFERDKWHELAAQTRIELAECHKMAGDKEKFARTAGCVAAAPEIDNLLRWTYFDEMRKYLDTLPPDRVPLVVPFEDMVKIQNVRIKNDPGVILQGTQLDVEIVVESNFPREILCQNIQLTLETISEPMATKNKNKDNNNSNSNHGYRKSSASTTIDKSQLSLYSKNSRQLTGADLKPKDALLQSVHLQKYLEYKQDRQLAGAGVSCTKPTNNNNNMTDLHHNQHHHRLGVRRKDSAPLQLNQHRNVSDEDRGFCLEAKNLPLVITPGANPIRLTEIASQPGKFYLGQLALTTMTGRLRLFSPYLTPRLAVEIKEEPPSIRLHVAMDNDNNNSNGPTLLSGSEQTMELIVTTGSYAVDPTSKIKLQASRGLTFQTLNNNNNNNNTLFISTTSSSKNITNKNQEEDPNNKSLKSSSTATEITGSKPQLTSTLEIELGQILGNSGATVTPFTSTKIPLRVMADLLTKDHQVTITCPWLPSNKPQTVKLSFTPPLTSQWRLHTVGHRKYVQVTVTGQCERKSVFVEGPILNVTCAAVAGSGNIEKDSYCKVKDLCCGKSSQALSHGSSLSYMWELVVPPGAEAPTIKAEFSVMYKFKKEESTPDNNKIYKYYFDINDYQTLYILEANVVPTKGNEFCRDGALCHLHLKIRSAAPKSAPTTDNTTGDNNSATINKNKNHHAKKEEEELEENEQKESKKKSTETHNQVTSVPTSVTTPTTINTSSMQKSQNHPKTCSNSSSLLTPSTNTTTTTNKNNAAISSNNNVATTKSVMYEVLAEQSVWAVCGRTAGVISFDDYDHHNIALLPRNDNVAKNDDVKNDGGASSSKRDLLYRQQQQQPQCVVLDVMPLTSGYLPLPLVRISKYIPAESSSDKSNKNDTHPRLEPFSVGQVYNMSKGKQVHVIAASCEGGGGQVT